MTTREGEIVCALGFVIRASSFMRHWSLVIRHSNMAITVRRPKLNWRERMYLPAIVAGLAITIKHFKNMLFGRTKVTMQYPEQKWDDSLPDHYRGAPALVRDEDGRVRCVACQLCEFICPPRAIKIIPGEIPSVDRFAKVEKYPRNSIST
jgi:NADH-quinone oxidoreductase subunit I